jgi:hypothetical protein
MILENLPPEKEQLMLKCACDNHALELKHDNEYGGIEITIWDRSPKVYPFSFKERLRWCWHILKTGKPWADYYILQPSDIPKVTTYLNDIYTEYKSASK